MKLKLFSLLLVFSLFMSCNLEDDSSNDSDVDSPFTSARAALEAIPDLSVDLPASLAGEESSDSRAVYDIATQPSVKAEGWNNIQGSLEMAQMGAEMVNNLKDMLAEDDSELEYNTVIPLDTYGSIIIIPVSETTVTFNATLNSGLMYDFETYMQVSMTDLGDEEFETTFWMLKKDGTVIQYSIFNTKTGENSLVYNNPYDAYSMSVKQIFKLVDDTIVLGQSYDLDYEGQEIHQDNYAWGNDSCGGIEASQTNTGEFPYTYNFSEYYDGSGNMIYGGQKFDFGGDVEDVEDVIYYALNYLTFKSEFTGYTLNQDEGTSESYDVIVVDEDGTETPESYSYMDYDWWIEDDDNDTFDGSDIDLSYSFAGEAIIEKNFFMWDEDEEQFLALMCNMLSIPAGETSSYFDVNTAAETSISSAKTGLNNSITTTFKSKLSEFAYPTGEVPEITEF